MDKKKPIYLQVLQDNIRRIRNLKGLKQKEAAELGARLAAHAHVHALAHAHADAHANAHAHARCTCRRARRAGYWRPQSPLVVATR